MAEPTDHEADGGRKTKRDGVGVSTLALVADLLFASRVRGAASAVGVRASMVRSADELIERARTDAPHLILLDLEARGVDAPAVIERLKTDPALASITVIAFGSHVRGDALVAAREAGADRVLARSAFVRELPSLLRGTDVADSEP